MREQGTQGVGWGAGGSVEPSNARAEARRRSGVRAGSQESMRPRAGGHKCKHGTRVTVSDPLLGRPVDSGEGREGGATRRERLAPCDAEVAKQVGTRRWVGRCSTEVQCREASAAREEGLPMPGGRVGGDVGVVGAALVVDALACRRGAEGGAAHALVSRRRALRCHCGPRDPGSRTPRARARPSTHAQVALQAASLSSVICVVARQTIRAWLCMTLSRADGFLRRTGLAGGGYVASQVLGHAKYFG